MSKPMPRTVAAPLAAVALLLTLAAAAGAAPQAQPAPQAPAAAPAPGAGASSAAPAEDPVLVPDQIPDTVATVDGQAITKADLLARATEAQAALAQRGVPPQPTTRTFYRSVLDDLIGNQLLVRDLEAQGKGAAAADVQQQMTALRGQFKSDQEFDDMLKARGFDRARLERDIRESLTVNRWVQETVMPSITVSETEQREFFADNQDAMIQPEGVRVRHVLLLVRPKDTADQKAAQRKKAEELRAKIAGGADFAAVAKESSEDPGTAPKGGEVGWIERGQTVPTFEQAAFTLEPGKLSDVVETRFGYHVIQVEEKRPEKKLAFAEVKEQIDALLKQRKLENAVRDRLNALGAKSKIDIKI